MKCIQIIIGIWREQKAARMHAAKYNDGKQNKNTTRRKMEVKVLRAIRKSCKK